MIKNAPFPDFLISHEWLAISYCDRAFSAGRQLITDFRSSLKAETITACMLLKDWFKQPDDVLYSSDDQETLRAWYRKYYHENKEQEKQRYRQYTTRLIKKEELK